MPPPILHELKHQLGPEGVLYQPEDLLLYEYDGSVERGRPDFVVFPRRTEDVVAIVGAARRHGVPLVGRGAGTGLSGGAIARRGGIVVSFARMNRILDVDVENRRARVQPGVVNSDLSVAVARANLHFAPDPSSQKACTIGGNVSENSGGPHTLAYGVTTSHVLALEVVLPTGELLHLGNSAVDTPGYDLPGLFVGTEGTFGLVTEITVKLTPLPEAVQTLMAVYDTVDEATETVAEITARGITPAACEMLDGWTIRAVESFVHAGFPLDCSAILLIDLDGIREEAAAQAEETLAVCQRHGAREVRVARDGAERELLWKGRKNAFGAIGRLSPTYYTQDGVIPRTKLPVTLRRIGEIGKKYGFEIGNIFHAGDGNLHPIILFDASQEQQFRNAVAAADEIIAFCVELGGAITGEHGVGMEKDRLMPLLFSEEDLSLMRRVRDIFNPEDLLNPGKVFPVLKSCGEIRARPAPAKSGVRA